MNYSVFRGPHGFEPFVDLVRRVLVSGYEANSSLGNYHVDTSVSVPKSIQGQNMNTEFGASFISTYARGDGSTLAKYVSGHSFTLEPGIDPEDVAHDYWLSELSSLTEALKFDEKITTKVSDDPERHGIILFSSQREKARPASASEWIARMRSAANK